MRHEYRTGVQNMVLDAFRPIRIATAGLLLLAVSACTSLYSIHGYAPLDSDLAQIIPGQTTREQVAELVGRPASSGILASSGWYYVSSRWKDYAYRAPQEIAREVVAISFSEAGVVQNVERYGLQDGQVVALSRRVTESNIKGISFIKQLLSNFGRVSAGQILK